MLLRLAGVHFGLLFLGGCLQSDEGREPLVVFAASSLMEAFTELEEAFENDEDGGSTSRRGAVPKGRAAKAAYFAKREIELTQQRRERERRKARYLEGSGGLKYTAIAMANKAEMT